MPATRVIVATTSEVKKKAFETSEIAAHLRAIGVNYQFVNADELGVGDEIAGERYPQPFTASGGMLAALQRVSSIRKATKIRDEIYDESGNLINEIGTVVDCDLIVIAIESFITENATDTVCIIVDYYVGGYKPEYVNGEKHELISFSPPEYVADFPEKYLQYLASVEKYQSGVKGFKMTIGEVIENDANGTNVRLNWHKLFNPFDRVEQIRGTLNYMVDEFKKIIGLF